jgi:hypothetical protein
VTDLVTAHKENASTIVSEVSMPFKANADRRNKFTKAKYRVTNWPEYDVALVRRGSLTVWLTDEAIAGWHAPATGKRGGQPTYSDLAIETGLALRLVLRLGLRQIEGMLGSIAHLLGVDIQIPDHTTFSRRGDGLTLLKKPVERNEPLHLLIDSTGLKMYGEGEVARREARKATTPPLAETSSRD